MKKSKFKKMWPHWLIVRLILAIVILMAGTTCFAVDFGAITDGNWSDTSTWYPASIPGLDDNVYIGSYYPYESAAASATVTLVQDQSAGNVYLGYSSDFPVSGTLDLGNHKLNIGGGLYLGYGGTGSNAIGTVNRGTGYFTASYLEMHNGNTFTFGSLDTVNSLIMYDASATTTAATGNVTGNADIYWGSSLTLGADMNLTGSLNLADDGSVLDMAHHALNATTIYLGWNGGSTTLLHRGQFTAYNLQVANQAFDLNPTDSITNFYLSNGTSTLNTPVSGLYLYNSATAATTSAGNVTGSVNIQSGSSLTLGADMTLTGSLNLQDDNSILDMAGHAINASQIYLSWNGGTPNLLHRGQFTASYLSVSNQTFDLNATDSITDFYLSNAASTLNAPVSTLTLYTNSTATTTAVGNVTGNVNIYSGSSLTLGADMNLTGSLDLANDGSVLDMAHHALNATTIYLGWNGGSPTLSNRGQFTAYNLLVANHAFDLNPTDSITNFYLSNGTSTLNAPVTSLILYSNSTAMTTAAGNVSVNVSISGGSSLTLGADMTLTNSLDLEDAGSTFNMAHHALNAYQINFGWYGTGTPTLSNRARLTTSFLSVANQTFDMNSTDSVANFYLRNGASTLNAPVEGLNLYNNATATTTAAGNVTWLANIYSGSKLTLGADMNLSSNLNLQDNGSTLDMAGHALTANAIYLGWNGGTTTLLNNGKITAGYLYIGGANTPTLHPGDLVENNLYIYNSSAPTVYQADGQLTGLTFNGTWQGSLGIDNTSVLNLHLGQSPYTHWIFRWQDPNPASNWGDVLSSLINAGRISFNVTNGYYMADRGGYTYIYGLPAPADFDWKGGNSAGPTDWSLAANWNPNSGTPYGQGVVLSFGAQSTANNIVDMGSSGKTVGGLVFVSATSTTIQSSGGYDLTLDNNGAVSTIDVSGNHCITTPVILNNDAQIIGLGTLTLSGGVSGDHDLDVQGNLVAGSIAVDTLTIESGATVTIQAIPGGPLGSTLTAVPEPSTLILMGIGTIGLLAYAWPQRRRIA